ncbi:hypothetical protein [Stygiolobus caldivivus]|uniref:Uncharacterized protein n=1 Tax=Stygiolobus caldivivus TaxID=2824673 RepID=A0A8D5U8I8_9CREN|nr:hypothetical protein [Stygiolobus caldivivus]BCU71000.1 hypothetical protein KN1_22970 [Stygiolobus caldivivus]
MSATNFINKTIDLMYAENYILMPTLFQLVVLIVLYSAGMAIPIFNLGLVGDAITAHIYGAAIVVILSFFVLGSAMRGNNLKLKALGLLNVLFCIFAAFEGLFYFGGYVDPSYALMMGLGFLGVLFTSSAITVDVIQRAIHYVSI